VIPRDEAARLLEEQHAEVAALFAELDEDAVVVAVLADAGWKYLSADFWSDGARTMEDHLWW